MELGLQGRFPNLVELLLESQDATLAAGSNLGPSNTAASCTTVVPRARTAAGQQLAAFMQQTAPQMPRLRGLRVSGPVGCRPAALDVSAALAAAAGSGVGLRQLRLRSSGLPDDALEAVGRQTGLQELELTSSRAMSTAQLSGLTGLTQLVMTVCPPLLAALAPVRSMRRLAVLRLRSLQPARGWYHALQVLAGLQQLTQLQLMFADLEDRDLAPLRNMSSLRVLDLSCSRHLTHAAVPHLAALPRLRELHLEHTGLVPHAEDMEMLGAGCPRLSELHVETLDLGRRGGGGGAIPAAVLGSPLSAGGGDGARWPPLSALCLHSSVGAGSLANALGQLQLTRLHVGHMGPGDATAQLLGSHPSLVALRLGGCGGMRDASYAALGGLAGLTALALADALLLPAARLGVLAAGTLRLRSLMLERCSGAGDALQLLAAAAADGGGDAPACSAATAAQGGGGGGGGGERVEGGGGGAGGRDVSGDAAAAVCSAATGGGGGSASVPDKVASAAQALGAGCWPRLERLQLLHCPGTSAVLLQQVAGALPSLSRLQLQSADAVGAAPGGGGGAGSAACAAGGGAKGGVDAVGPGVAAGAGRPEHRYLRCGQRLVLLVAQQ